MAYAATADMIDRFGEAEMVRLTTPAGQAMEEVGDASASRALADASGQIDSYLRPRYRVPLDPVPAEIRRAACMLARYDLSMGDGRAPSDQTAKARDDVIAWLRSLAAGTATLEGATPASGGTGATARDTDRVRVFDRDSLRGW